VKLAVVAAGVVGTATAWHVARRGHRVVVVEASSIAAGASGGLGERGVRANGRDETELPLARRAHEMWPTLDDALGSDTGFRRIGHLHVIEHDDGRAEQVVERQRAAGIDSEIVRGDELRALEPDLDRRAVAAVHCPTDGVADHTATTNAYADAARRAGVEIREDCTAQLRIEGDRLRVRDADADFVLIAANAGARSLLKQVDVRLPTANVYPQVLVTAPLERVVVRHLIGHASRPLAIKTLPDLSVMITGGRLGRDGVVDAAEVEANAEDAAAVIPALRGVPIEIAVCDRAESVTRDLLPIVDRVPGTDNAIVAAGWSGHGWAIAPAVAELLAVWITEGGRPPEFAPFSWSRFDS
jgi:sarcosine oxidase subunit beta